VAAPIGVACDLLHVTDWLRNSRPGRALRWRVLAEWPWLSLQLVALFLTIRVGELTGSLSGPARIAVLIAAALILFGIADIVTDKVDERVDAVPASEYGQRG
jgi:hypothetical protein